MAATGCSKREARPVDTLEIYRLACAKCHGDDGHGGLPSTPGEPPPRDFSDAAWQASRSDEELHAIVRQGRKAMPAFGDTLTPQELDAVVRHVRRLGQGGAGTAPASPPARGER